MNAIATTFTAQIYMAGDIDHAKQLIRRIALAGGLCVTVEPLSFIYMGGEESGFRVGFINYPRFPEAAAQILSRAISLANHLREELGQHSYSIVMPDETIWDSLRDPSLPSTLIGR